MLRLSILEGQDYEEGKEDGRLGLSVEKQKSIHCWQSCVVGRHGSSTVSYGSEVWGANS